MKKQGQTLTRLKKAHVRLSDLRTKPDVFQFRDNEVENHHVEAIADVVRQKGTVDPLDVWKDPSNGELVVIDGHHRHAAFRRVGSGAKVPVVIWEGTGDAAKLHALRENAKARLPMTASERANAAWRLVCHRHQHDEAKPVYSKAQISKATGVSDGTVATMRRTHRRLNDADQAVIPETWQGALALLQGNEREELNDDEREAIIQQRADRLDEKVGKEIAQMADLQFEALIRMLEKRLGSKVRILADWWRDVDAIGDEYGEEEESLPF